MKYLASTWAHTDRGEMETMQHFANSILGGLAIALKTLRAKTNIACSNGILIKEHHS